MPYLFGYLYRISQTVCPLTRNDRKKILIGISETHCSLSTSAVTRIQSSTSAGDLRVVKVDDGLRYVIECEEADAGGVPGAPGNASMDDETL